MFHIIKDVRLASKMEGKAIFFRGVYRLSGTGIVDCFVLYCIFSCIFVIIICFFKAASLDGHMAFLVAVHCVIFWL